MILRKWHSSHVRLCAFMCVYASCVRACVLMFRSCSFCARRTTRSHSYTCITTAPCLVFGGLESSGLPVECVRILTSIVACISVCVYVSVCMSVCVTVIFRYCVFQVRLCHCFLSNFTLCPRSGTGCAVYFHVRPA